MKTDAISKFLYTTDILPTIQAASMSACPRTSPAQLGPLSGFADVSGCADFAPVLGDARTFTAWDLAAFWIGLVVSITTWYLAGGLVEMGTSI